MRNIIFATILKLMYLTLTLTPLNPTSGTKITGVFTKINVRVNVKQNKSI